MLLLGLCGPGQPISDQSSPTIPLFERPGPALGCCAIRVISRCCWLMATACCSTGSVLVKESAESGIVHLLKIVDWGAVVFRRITQLGSTEFGSKAVIVETLPRTRAEIHEVDWRTWELQLEDQQWVIGDLAWEPDIDDRSRKIVPRYHNVEGPPERVSWPDHRLSEPEWVQDAVELDGIGVVRVQMDVDVTGDKYWTIAASTSNTEILSLGPHTGLTSVRPSLSQVNSSFDNTSWLYFV